MAFCAFKIFRDNIWKMTPKIWNFPYVSSLFFLKASLMLLAIIQIQSARALNSKIPFILIAIDPQDIFSLWLDFLILAFALDLPNWIL